MTQIGRLQTHVPTRKHVRFRLIYKHVAVADPLPVVNPKTASFPGSSVHGVLRGAHSPFPSFSRLVTHAHGRSKWRCYLRTDRR